MLSIAIQDTAISLEMPLFAFLHMLVHRFFLPVLISDVSISLLHLCKF